MAKEWNTKCKDCGNEFGYSDYSYQFGAERGQSRPERCPTCRKIHNRLTGVMGFAYFELKPRSGVDITQIKAGGLGKLNHPLRPHSSIENESRFDPNKFGVTDADIRQIFDWFMAPTHQVAVVVGPTGSGKSTALPYRLIHPPEGIPEDFFTRYGQVLITQPRIQATRNIPAYVAKDLYGSRMGAGFDIGFRYKNHPYADWRNRLVYATDGTLINWLVNGQIANLSLIMIDEAHERSLNIDLILGLLKKLLPRYPHLKLIVASATIDSELFLGYFGTETARIIEFAGKRKFNVKTIFQEESEALPYDQVPRLLKSIPNQLANKIVWLLEEIQAGNKPSGDILGFLQGEKPIEEAVAAIRHAVKANPLLNDIDVYPLYTTLPQEEQNKALLSKPDPTRRRVVITTNVAETSLTVEDVVYVVDSGLINEAQWDPDSQTKRVVTVLHSRAGCKQRWGRAGRVRDGEAHCLYTESQFYTEKKPNEEYLFPEYTVPQIQRSDLETVVLAAKAAGIDNLSTFNWIQRPPEKELERAPQALKQIGALDDRGDLTEHGLELQSFGEEPALANLMAMADQFACAIEMATLIPMMKLGGMRFLLKNDKKWDAVTRRKVNVLHKALMAGCQDDLEFCLKIYTAWAEAEWDGRLFAPDWAIAREWPQRVPKLPSSIEELLGENLQEFKARLLTAKTRGDIENLQEKFNLGEAGRAWIATAQNNFLNAQRAAWGRTYFINHSLLKEKIEPERNLLLDALSGHKKEVERRPIDFSRLDRVRLLMAACLPNRIYVSDKTPGSLVDFPQQSSDTPNLSAKTGLNYVPWLSVHKAESQVDNETHIPVQINLDSVNYEQTLDAFACGKQQVIVHPLTPGGAPESIMHVSYLAKIHPEWLPEIQNRKNSLVCFGRYINRVCPPLTGQNTELEEQAYIHLFLDQLFPIGSRWEYVIQESPEQGQMNRNGKPVRQQRPMPEIDETFRGDEPELFSSADDYEDVANADLVDTVLTKKDQEQLVRDLEEDALHPWQTMDIGAEQDPYQLAAEDILYFDQSKEVKNTIVNNDADTRLIDYLSKFVDWQVEAKTPNVEEISLLVEVAGFDFSELRPVVLFTRVPERDPFTEFAGRFSPGQDVPLTVIGYDQRPGDYLISLVTREPVSGLEILLEAEEITFGGRGALVKEIPCNTILNTRLEALDPARQRAYPSLLPAVEKFRDLQLEQVKNFRGIYDLEANVKDIGADRVHFLLDLSQPENGLLLTAGIGSKGLHKGTPSAYALGEKCNLRLQFQQRESHTNLDELPEEIESSLSVQRIYANLTWEAGSLSYQGRMSYDTALELQAGTASSKFRRAIKDLYRYSNMPWGETVDASWEKMVREKYPIGSLTSTGRVSGIKDFGAFIELDPGIRGLLHKQEITWQGNMPPSDFLQDGQEITVRVIRVDFDKHEIGLSVLPPNSGPGEKYRIGGKYLGKVINFNDSGIIIELEPGLNGYVHKSKMFGFVTDPREMANLGDQLYIEILNIDQEQRRISLNMKLPENNPYSRLRIGEIREGRVTKLEAYGVFVSIGQGMSGLLHKSAMGWRGPFNVGDTVKVVILSVDVAASRISFGLA